jgi:hypothetical protein
MTKYLQHKGRNTLTILLLGQADSEGWVDLLGFDGKVWCKPMWGKNL